MYQPEPQVANTIPQGYSNDVDTQSPIDIMFNADLDRDHITDSIFVTDGNGNPVGVQISYANRTIHLRATVGFQPSTRYTVRLVGGADKNGKPQGIRSILNVPLAKDFLLTFNTIVIALLPGPNAITPMTQSIIQVQPQFSWSPVPGAVGYQAKVSTSPLLVPVVWPANSDVTIFSNTGPILPDYLFPDGTYYWTVRAVDAIGNYGHWSPVYSFGKDTLVQATQASGDTVAPDAVPYYESTLAAHVDVLEIFPADNATNVSLGLRALYIRLNGRFTGADIRAEDIVFNGQNVDGMTNNPDFPDHGNVSYTLDVLPQNDGTTILKLTLDTVTFNVFMSQQF